MPDVERDSDDKVETTIATIQMPARTPNHHPTLARCLAPNSALPTTPALKSDIHCTKTPTASCPNCRTQGTAVPVLSCSSAGAPATGCDFPSYHLCFEARTVLEGEGDGEWEDAREKEGGKWPCGLWGGEEASSKG